MSDNYKRLVRSGLIVFAWLLGAASYASAQSPAYAIVTSSEIRGLSAQLDAFVSHKAERGFDVYVFDESDWLGAGLTGDPAAEALRGFLQSVEALHDLDYLLIIGDPRVDAGPVPMKTLHPRTFGYQSTTPNGWNADCDSFVMTQDPVPTDYYYSDVDGDWDLDGDGLFGEFGDYDATSGPTGDFGPGGVDRGHDFAVGRIPVYSSDATELAQGILHLDAILLKTMAYQSAARGSIGWRRSALIAAEGANRIFYGETLRDNVFLPTGFQDVARVYDATACLVSNPPAGCVAISGAPEATTCSVSNVFSEWTDTPKGVVTWLTHGGGVGAASVMNTTQSAFLDDSHPAFTFQASCFNSQPSQTNNLSFALLKNGAIGAIGSTEISHGPGGPNPPLTNPASAGGNAGLGYYFMQGLTQDGLTAGDALAEVKRDTDLYGRCWYWQNMAAFVLYGDPEVGLYQQKAPPLPSLSLPALSALVTLVLGGGIWGIREIQPWLRSA